MSTVPVFVVWTTSIDDSGLRDERRRDRLVELCLRESLAGVVEKVLSAGVPVRVAIEACTGASIWRRNWWIRPAGRWIWHIRPTCRG